MNLFTEKELLNFITESNAIENIFRAPLAEEIAEFRRFLSLDVITIDELKKFVKIYQPDALLRDKKGLDVRVGSYLPPKGGSEIHEQLDKLLNKDLDAYNLHCLYEMLHPFTDGNGRSGRALWAWKMKRFPIGFLRMFYYQSLAHYGEQ